MKVLVINAGSSSLKYQLIDMANEDVIAKGNCEKIGEKSSFIVYKTKTNNIKEEIEFPSHTEAISKVLSILQDKEIGVVGSLDEIQAFGHRVVHGGEVFKCATLVDEEAMKNLNSLKPLAPLHNPANIEGILSCQKLCPTKPNVVMCDSSFHQTMPKHAFVYGVPLKAYEDWKIRRYGFHGTSHFFVSRECAKLMNKNVEDLKIITVHIGNGSSICAVDGGKSVDTSMGFTPIDGLIMGTRCGELDPSVLEYINKQTGWSIEEITTYLNKKSGMLGFNGITNDMRDNNDLILQGNEGAKLFLDVLCYRIKKYVGAYAAVMGGVDAIVFTGGIGENQEDLRDYCLANLKFLGIEVDLEKNYNLPRGTAEEISTPASKVKVYRIPTDEELVIARECVKLCK